MWLPRPSHELYLISCEWTHLKPNSYLQVFLTNRRGFLTPLSLSSCTFTLNSPPHFLAHDELDCYKSLFLNIDFTQINCLRVIQIAVTHVVTETPKHQHITPVLKSLHWLKIPNWIKTKSYHFLAILQSSDPHFFISYLQSNNSVHLTLLL